MKCIPASHRLRLIGVVSGALLTTALSAHAALGPGRLPLTTGGTDAMAPSSPEAFACGTCKTTANDHAWRRSIHALAQAQAQKGQLPAAPPLDYVYNDVWVIEDDGTLTLSGTNTFDTNGQTHQYAANGGGVYTISSIVFSFDAALGSTIAPGDDGAVLVALPFSFPYAGGSYASVYVSGNGAVSFGAAMNPNGYYDNGDFFSTTPKIAGFYLDLNPAAGGTVNAKSDVTKATITWAGVPEYGTAKLNTVQVVLYPSGNFTITYNGIASTTQTNGQSIIIGYHPGGAPVEQEISYSAGLPFVSAPNTAVFEQYFSYVNPLVDEVALLNRFYQQFPDDFFQLVFFTNFQQTMSGFANELNIKNDVTGIGLGIFDSSNQYGSSGVLESRCNMNRIDAWAADPAARVFGKGNNFLTIMGQEAGHRWGAFMNFEDSGGQPSNLILGRSDAHWSYYVDVDHSSLEGGNWVNTGGSNYTCPTNIDYFSEIDEYAFGLRTPEEVKDFFFVSSIANNDPAARSVGTPLINATCSGTYVPVTVADIQAVEGPRTPLEGAENKDLRQGFIFLIQSGTTPTQAQLDKIAGFRAAWEPYFEKSCDGRLAVNTSLTQTFAVAVICGLVKNQVTTEILPDFTAHSLERGFDQHVPNGGRYTFRYMADGSSGSSEAATIVFTHSGFEPETLVTDLTYGTQTCIDVLMTPIQTAAGAAPAITELHANHPNPFNPVTTIDYTLAAAGRARLTVFDATGGRVRVLVDANEAAGPHSVTFDGRDDAQHELASGVYFYRLEAGNVTRTRKMVLLK